MITSQRCYRDVVHKFWGVCNVSPKTHTSMMVKQKSATNISNQLLFPLFFNILNRIQGQEPTRLHRRGACLTENGWKAKLAGVKHVFWCVSVVVQQKTVNNESFSLIIAVRYPETHLLLVSSAMLLFNSLDYQRLFLYFRAPWLLIAI